MNAQQIIYEQSAIDEEVKRIADRLGFEAVYDGVISPEHYVLRPIKVSWILREPHDSGGDYDYKEDIIDKLSKNKIGRSKYFDPMRYLEYSLDNNLTFYEDIPNSDEDVNISNMLLNTAFTNISKIVGGARVRDWGIFWQNVEIFSSVVKRQIEIANPTIIVASGTIDFFRHYGFLENSTAYPKSYRNYYAVGKRIILDCYHLSYPFSQEELCDDIILALKDAKDRGLLN